MSCPGLHCPGCSGAQSLGILAAAGAALAVAYETVAVVAEYIVPAVAVVVVCFALAVAASVWLERWSDRRAAAWGAARGIRSRADVILPARSPAAFPPAGTPPAIEQHVHYHYHAPGGELAADVAPATPSPYPRQPGAQALRHSDGR